MGMQAMSSINQRISGVGKMIFGLHQNKLANKIKPVRTDYSISPYAQNQLGLAQQLYNGRMAGASQQEQNILASQGNMMANVNRNASDSSQALAMAGAAQGQTNQALANLGLQEAQNKYQMLGNMNNAYGNMTNELDKVYQDKMNKYMEDVRAKAALRNAAWQNMGAGFDQFQNAGMNAAPSGLATGQNFGGLDQWSTPAMPKRDMSLLQYGGPSSVFAGPAMTSNLFGR